MFPLSIILLAYLLGSIPFGYLIVKMFRGGDVRETGSGGTGATNVTRSAGKGAGIVTLLLDALKGMLAVCVARWLLADDFGVNWWVTLATLATMLGHVFPVWLKFRGGKGVATGLGIFLILSPTAVLCAVPVFVVIVWVTRYVSLGSITAAAIVPLWIWLTTGRDAPSGNLQPLTAAAAAAAAIIILMHRANIGRLLRGTENKLKL